MTRLPLSCASRSARGDGVAVEDYRNFLVGRLQALGDGIALRGGVERVP